MPKLDGKEYEYTEEGIEQYEEDKKRFRDYQPEGILTEKAPLLDKFLSFIPDPYQISNYMSDKKGRPSLDKMNDFLIEEDIRVARGLREIEAELALQRKEIRDAIRKKGSPLTDKELETIRSRNSERKRNERAEGGEIEKQMAAIMPEEEMVPETSMVPDEQMEDDYTDFIIGESLTPEDEEYLLTALEQDDRLSMIFDQVVETASEFSGSGPVKGPGSEMSDSIPARLSDGEFVMTAKAANEIGPDNLQGMMEHAEVEADDRERRIMQAGGYVEEAQEEQQEEQEIVRAIQPKERQGRLMPRSLADKKVNESMIALNPRNSLFAR